MTTLERSIVLALLVLKGAPNVHYVFHRIGKVSSN